VSFDGLQNAGFGFFTETMQLADALFVRHAQQLFRRFNRQVVIQRADFFGTEPGNLEQFGHAGGYLSAQALAQRTMAGRDDLADLA
jgi:hypothetical protein